MGGFMLALLSVAALNFAQILYEAYEAASVSRTSPDGFTVTACYFGPPAGFYPRFFVFTFLLTACLGCFTKSFRGRSVSLLGVAAAFSVYLYWWVDSHRAFKNFSSYEIDFLNHPEVAQVAYLYNGNWWDVCLAVSLFTALVLQARGFAPRSLADA
jgi:hypothetical protein